MTVREWPSSVAVQTPVVASQSCTVLSQDPEARRVPSGEKATALTYPEWPPNIAVQFPVIVSQSRTVWSSDPEASWVPSGENITDLISP